MGIVCEPSSGPLVGTLLARCNCFFETLDKRIEAIGCVVLSIGFELVLVIAGVEALEAENFFRFLVKADTRPRRPKE